MTVISGEMDLPVWQKSSASRKYADKSKAFFVVHQGVSLLPCKSSAYSKRHVDRGNSTRDRSSSSLLCDEMNVTTSRYRWWHVSERIACDLLYLGAPFLLCKILEWITASRCLRWWVSISFDTFTMDNSRMERFKFQFDKLFKLSLELVVSLR